MVTRYKPKRDSDLPASYAPITGPREKENKSEPKSDNESVRMADYWKEQIKAVDEVNARWHERGDQIIKRYRDERDRASEEGQRRLNVLWSNIQILKPAMYAKMPQAVAERRFLDRDPVGRLSSQILQRALRDELTDNGFHEAMKQAVDSRLLAGRGINWVRYEPKFEMGDSIPPQSADDMQDSQGDIEPIPDDEEEEKLEDTGEELIEERVMVDSIHWKDFYVFPARARTWKQVQAVGKKLHMSENECIERFGEEIGEKIKPDPQTQSGERIQLSSSMFQAKNERRRIIYEIWNKVDRKAYWVSTGYDECCDVKDDPLGLNEFFPTPEPLSATMTDDSMIPIPDFHQYQDQALQVDELTQRISLLSKAVRIVGTYDGSNRALRRLLNESLENDLIPVDHWAMHAEKGGIKGSMSLFPLEEITTALQTCLEVREKILTDIQLITGVSDVLRGTTDARETMGGSRLKSNNASSRIEASRDDVARLARDTVKLVAEVMCKHYDPQTLVDKSGILYEEGIVPDQPQPPGAPQVPGMAGTPPGGPGLAVGPSPSPPGGSPQPPTTALPSPMATPPTGTPPNALVPQPPLGLPPAPQINPLIAVAMKIKKAIDLLRNDITRGYRIDVETDQTIAGDSAQERQDAIDFIKEVSGYLETMGQMVMTQPAIAPLLGKMLQFGVRRFRVGRDLESTIDEFVDKLEKQSQQPQPNKGPSPEQIKAQGEQAKAEAEIKKAQLDAQAQQANDQREQQRMQLEAQNQAQEDQREQQRAQMDLQIKQQEFAMRMQEMQREQEFKTAEHAHRMAQLHQSQSTGTLQ